jgi:hypothetical protein
MRKLNTKIQNPINFNTIKIKQQQKLNIKMYKALKFDSNKANPTKTKQKTKTNPPPN